MTELGHLRWAVTPGRSVVEGSCYERELSILHRLFIAYLPHSKAFVCSMRQLPVTAILKGFIAVKYQVRNTSLKMQGRRYGVKSQCSQMRVQSFHII